MYFEKSVTKQTINESINVQLTAINVNHRFNHLHILLRPHLAGKVIHHELTSVAAHLLAELAVVVEGEDSLLKRLLVTCLGEDATC